ncbi:MAG: ABC transporter ATP-binding protein [Thaumarchaeota archaeon]|nr:ABC transporter ATP-binding protein [Nitrososphaerota archaeon]MDG6931448.1 ABC transporter ATP-binding protein [Nitrososphaerota archaeon]
MIELQDLRKVYENGQVALNGVSASFKGRVTSIIGRNGAGKTTMMRILSTQLIPTSGSATINGMDIFHEQGRIRRSLVSIPQEGRPIGLLTPLEHLKIYLAARGMSFKDASEAASYALKKLELWEFRNRPTDTLSGGMKRKLFVAMAIAANAETVFLDEPTTGLDPVSRLEVWSAIKELSSEVLLTTHYMEEALALSDEVVFMDNGMIIKKGKIAELLSDFEGKIRVESTQPVHGWTRIGNTYISYADTDSASEYVRKGYSVKQVTLEDLFVRYGVQLE